MDLTDEHKRSVSFRLVETIIQGLEKNTFSYQDFQEVATYIIDSMERVITKKDLLSFLRELSSKWRVFTPVLVYADGQLYGGIQTQTAHDFLTRAKEGDIQGALEEVSKT